MTLDLTSGAVYLIGLLCAVVTVVLVPWIRSKLGAEKFSLLERIITMAVSAAEQLAATKTGQDLITAAGGKLSYATQHALMALAKVGVTFDADTIRAAIEAKVKELFNSQEA